MELDFIQQLRKRIPNPEWVRVGIGDDAAVLVASGELVVTTDMLMDGIDFHCTAIDPRRIGRKSLAVNLSDLAAMAARPWSAVISLALPRDGGMELGEQLYAGLLPLAEQFNLAIVGGDTNSWDGPLVISVTALGKVTPRGPLLRSGARVGDEIFVTGSFGGSIRGRHFDFTPRVAEALWLHENFEIHAAIDVSDGLSLDLARVAEASLCGAAIDLQRIPVSEDARQLSLQPGDRWTPLEHALADGEDFELVLAVPPTEAQRLLASPSLPVPITRIGQFVAQPGLWQIAEDGSYLPIPPRGYEHRLT